MAKRVLLVMTNRAVSGPLRDRLEAGGWSSVLVETVSALKAALADRTQSDFQAVLIDVRLQAEPAGKLLTLVRRSVAKTCRLVLADDFLDEGAMNALEDAHAIVRLGGPSSDFEVVAARLVPPSGPLLPPTKYDVNVINCFVTSANDVLEYYVGTKPEHSRPTVATSKRVPSGFVAAVVAFTGEQGGSASLSCEKAFIVDIASRINGRSKREIESDTAALVQTVEEMADQIFGKAELLLVKLGYELKVANPQVRVGDGSDFELKGVGPVVIIPFTLAKKKFYVGFSLSR